MTGIASFINFIVVLMLMVIPLIALYFIIKMAIKNAIKELKEGNEI